MKEKYKIEAPKDNSEDILLLEPTLSILDDETFLFIDLISKSILIDKDSKKYPELISFAYWFRKTNMENLKKYCYSLIKDRIVIPYGLVFHIAPSNIDTMFLYSLFLSMIMGNKNIIRISSNESDQIDYILTIIEKVIKSNLFPRISKSFLIIKYDHNDEVTEHFSNLCDIRVIWGGDLTIKKIRSIPLNPAAKEITFSDKFSFSIINPYELESDNDFKLLANNYYNDSFTFNQMACSSSRAIFWVGEQEKIKDKVEKFWDIFNRTIDEKHKIIEDSILMNKLNIIYFLAMTDNIKIINNSPNISRIKIYSSEVDKDYRDYCKCGGGLFLEYYIENINNIVSFLSSKDQTIGIYGFSRQQIIDFLFKNKIKGINRIVSIGKALEFSPIWDSHNLLYEFSKEIDIGII